MKVGILGAGSIARAMAMAVNGLEGVEGYAVASRELGKAQAFCNQWGFQRAYGSYEEMLQDPQVDLVYVATPHSHHFEHAKLCIEHGKPALVEKAFTANAAQARELIALAERRGVFLTEAIWVRYMPSCRMLRELIDSGIIGTVQRVSADLSYPIPNVKRLTDPALAGGALLDLGVYVLNFASMVLGDDIQEIKGLCTYCDSGVDCQESITITYPDGKMAALTASMLTASHRLGLIYGTKGYIHCININNIQGFEVYDLNHNLVKTVEVPRQINGYEYEVLACKKALEEGALECPEMPHSETVRMMEWMDKLRSDWGVRFPFEA